MSVLQYHGTMVGSHEWRALPDGTTMLTIHVTSPDPLCEEVFYAEMAKKIAVGIVNELGFQEGESNFEFFGEFKNKSKELH